MDLDRYPEILYCSDRINSENNYFLSEYVKIVSDFNMENPVFLLYGSWAERVGIEYARLSKSRPQDAIRLISKPAFLPGAWNFNWKNASYTR